jgi:cobalt-zinc-cadmium efflux system outer membrane protein
VSVTIPLPLFNRGKTELERLRAERERSEARGQALRQAIAAQVRGAYITLELRRKVSADYAATSARMSSELTQIARIAYQEGEVGILEVLDTYRSSHQSELRSLDLKAAIGQAEIELERAVGMPVLTPAVAP